MVRNTYTGISQVDNNMIEAAKAMGSTRNQILWKIKIPLAMPVILSGIKSMITMTIALTGIASFIGDGGFGGCTWPENVYQLSVSIKGKHYTWFRMASVNK